MIAEDHLEFLRALWSRRTPFTYIFLVLNISIFLLMELAGGTTNEATLMAFGVKSNAEINQGEIWRLVTPIFIHIGILHLFFNSYALWIVGSQVEKLYGSERFLLLYVLTGTAGVLGSYFYHPHAISAGASGAIFGLFGVLVAFGIRYRKSIPPFFKRAVGTGVLPVIVINLIIGFSFPAIDNSAHIAGLIAGAVLALLVPFQEPGARTRGLFRGAQIVLVLIICASFYKVAANYDGPRPSFRNLSRSWGQMVGSRSSIQDFIDAVNAAQRAFGTSARQLDSGQAEGLAGMQADTAKAIDQLRGIPSLGAKADELTAELLRLMEDQYELITDIQRAGTMTFAHNRKLEENTRRYADLMRSFSDWAETDGRKFGIAMGKRL